MIKCDICKKGNKGRYVGKIIDGKSVTICNDCYYGPSVHTESDETKFNKLQTPYWKLLGLKPKPHEIQLEKYLKSKNMNYGDWYRARSLGAKFGSALPDFEKHYNKYGRNNAPSPSFRKES